MNQLISKKNIPTHERLIVALDVPAIAEAELFVEELGESACFYKIGMELFMSGNCFDFIESLKKKQKKIFVDLKFFDVPETVGRAIKALSSKGVDFATVHGNDAMLAAAVKEKGALMVFAVTALTSLDQGDLADLGFKCNVEELVLSRAKRALALGCDGVISSGLEVGKLRASLDNKLVVITPGIRPVDNAIKDDQKRVVSVGDAFKNGADYIVMGRPIRDAENRKEIVDNIQLEIKRIFNS